MEESKRPPCCSRAILMDWFSANRSIPFTILLYGIAGTSLLAISMKLSLRKLVKSYSQMFRMMITFCYCVFIVVTDFFKTSIKQLMLWSPLAWLILGYIHVNIDDCWSNLLRDSKGKLVPHPETFPQGNKLLADYVHSKGLKLGIYSDAG
ncbi:unnamed protein product [Brassica rapa subsp. trilocularis]